VQAIAEAHHGSARVRSPGGQGATFEIVIPAVSALPRPGAIMARCRAE
jgi:signal transduction histidine kinase